MREVALVTAEKNLSESESSSSSVVVVVVVTSLRFATPCTARAAWGVEGVSRVGGWRGVAGALRAWFAWTPAMIMKA